MVVVGDMCMCVCVLQFLMHANLIHVNTTVDVPTLPTGFTVDAMTNTQEAPAPVGVSIPLISRNCTSQNLFMQ